MTALTALAVTPIFAALATANAISTSPIAAALATTPIAAALATTPIGRRDCRSNTCGAGGGGGLSGWS